MEQSDAAMDSMEEVHEEWLSEELLSDDDLNSTVDNNAIKKANIIDSQQNFDNTTLSDELDTFLIRKTDGEVLNSRLNNVNDNKSDSDETRCSDDYDDDDGDSTDNLLKLLGGDDDYEMRSKFSAKNKLKASKTNSAENDAKFDRLLRGDDDEDNDKNNIKTSFMKIDIKLDKIKKTTNSADERRDFDNDNVKNTRMTRSRVARSASVNMKPVVKIQPPSSIQAVGVVGHTKKQVALKKVSSPKVPAPKQTSTASEGSSSAKKSQVMKKVPLKKLQAKRQSEDTSDRDSITDKVLKTGKVRMSKGTPIRKMLAKVESEDMSDRDVESDVSMKKSRFNIKKNSRVEKVAPKAEPEDMSDDSDAIKFNMGVFKELTEDLETIKNIFITKQKKVLVKNEQVKSPKTQTKRQTYPAKNTSSGNNKTNTQNSKQASSKVNSPKQTIKHVKTEAQQKENNKIKQETPKNVSKSVVMQKKTRVTPRAAIGTTKQVARLKEEYMDQDIDDTNHFDPPSEDYDMNETQEFMEEEHKTFQLLMKPEEMDEEIPSDEETNSEDIDSLCDELSSDSERDSGEWFTLDLREERAPDYISLLGENAHQLLLEEKQLASSKLESLRQSLTVLADSGRQQADKIKKASLALAELDAMLAAV